MTTKEKLIDIAVRLDQVSRDLEAIHPVTMIESMTASHRVGIIEMSIKFNRLMLRQIAGEL